MNNNAQNGSFCNVTTKYCSRIQIKTRSTMLAIAPLAPNGWFCANCVS